MLYQTVGVQILQTRDDKRGQILRGKWRIVSHKGRRLIGRSSADELSRQGTRSDGCWMKMRGGIERRYQRGSAFNVTWGFDTLVFMLLLLKIPAICAINHGKSIHQFSYCMSGIELAMTILIERRFE